MFLTDFLKLSYNFYNDYISIRAKKYTYMSSFFC